MGIEIGASVGIWVMEHSGKWGYRKMLKVMNRKIFPAIKNRVRITIPNDAHCVSNKPEVSLEFVADVGNPNPLDITIYKIETAILYQNTLLGTETRCLEIKVPKETHTQRIALATYYPLSNILQLPAENKGWRLEATIYLQCYYGIWEYHASNLDFSVGGDWQTARDKLSKLIRTLRDGVK